MVVQINRCCMLKLYFNLLNNKHNCLTGKSFTPVRAKSQFQKLSVKLSDQMSNPDCIFCKICCKQQQAECVYEDGEIIAFKDIKPCAEHHYLVVPVNHIEDVNKLNYNDKVLLQKLISTGKQILEEKGCNVNDALLGFHCPPFNSVRHLHLHVLAPASQMTFFRRLIFKPNTWWFSTADSVLQRLEQCKM